MAIIFNSNELLQELRQQVRETLRTTRQSLLTSNEQNLLKKPAPGKWSAAECIEHLNIYNRIYQPRITAVLEQSLKTNLPPQQIFKSSWLGNYFTKTMQPKSNGELSMRMKTPASARPQATIENLATLLTEFEAAQLQWLQLLEQAQQTNLQYPKISTTLASFIKLSPGDTLRFNIAHQNRHLLQALKALYPPTSNPLSSAPSEL